MEEFKRTCSMDRLVSNVIEWADEKDILKKENSFKQMCKVLEEVGEVAAALARDDKDELIDGIGDSLVTLIILAKQNGLDPVQCLNSAYNVIKKRKGKTINGIFVKEDDLKTE
jgi:NTP pyrophosphatase (non-canonical NTP hydrolase)